MHGRVKREEREREESKTAEDRREELSKVRMYHEVAQKVLTLRQQRVYADRNLLPLTSHLVLLNPEFHIVWGYRREILQSLLARIDQQEARQQDDSPVVDSAGAGGAEEEEEGEELPTRDQIAATELKLTFDALQRHPKSYSSWFQRQWIIDQGLYGNLKKEIALCNKLLELDERNFHCWNYRRHVCRRAGVSREDELAFAMLKIEQNFSNYSALHHRSITLPKPLTREILEDEIAIVQQAVFTEPDDQSAWFYYRWLMTSMLAVIKNCSSDHSDEVESFLQSQVQWMLELLEMEAQCKWVLCTLADVQARLASASSKEENAKEATRQSEEYYTQLIALDADHAQYYRDMIAKIPPTPVSS